MKRSKLSSEAILKEFTWDVIHNDPDKAYELLGAYSDAVDEGWLSRTHSDRILLLTDVANLRNDGAGWFWKTREKRIRPESTKDLLQIRDQLRSIWREPTSYNSDLVVKEWLSWQPSKAHLEAYDQFGYPAPEVPFKCSIKLGKFIPDQWGLRPLLIQGILEHWHHFKFCANPSCLAPYFIAKRGDQMVCDAGACKAERQRQHALTWWRENRQGQAKPQRRKKGRKA